MISSDMVIDHLQLGETLTDTLTGWMTAMFAVAGLLLTATPFVSAGSARKWTLGGCAIFALAGFVFLGIGTLKDLNGASPHPSTAPPTPTSNPSETSLPPSSQPTSSKPPSSDRAASDPTTPDEPQPSKQYLSQLQVADSDHDSGTGGWESGAKDINGQPFGHSISMNAGCQNSDGGDYWIDYTIGSDWKQLSGNVGLDGKSSTEATGKWQILDSISGRELASGSVAVGPAKPFNVDVSEVTRVRLFISNPNSPNQMCGFVKIRTTVVWGDATLTQ
jgi:hypothetical protein